MYDVRKTGSAVTLLPVLALLAAIIGWATLARSGQPLNHTYRVGVDHAPPYNILLPGEPVTGLAVEVLEEAARRKEIHLEFVRLAIPVDEAFRGNLVDMWPAATDTPERRKWLHLTEPWISNGLCIVSRKEKPIRKTQDLEEKSVSVIRNRITLELVGKAISTVKVVEVPDRAATLGALCRGTVDAAILEQRYFEQALLDRIPGCETTKFVAINAAGMERMLTILAAPQVADAADTLRQGITEMMEDGTYFRILDHWSPYTGTESRTAQALIESKRRTTIYRAAFAVISFLILLLIWQYFRLKAAHRKASEAAHVKAEFLASVSHELRTPMNGILGMSQVLLETPLDSDQREQTQIIRQSAESLIKIINDILDVSKIEAGKLRLDVVPFDPHRVLEQTYMLTQVQARQKRLDCRIEIHPDVPRRVMGDPDRLRQVLLNLLINAVKFTDQGEVWMKASTQGLEHGRVVLRIDVGDTGIGIAPEKLPRLFQKFYQAETSTTRKRGGTGLGLAISQQLARVMGGDIQVASEFGKGSIFTVTVPVQVSESHSATTQTPRILAAEPLSRPPRVLLVEDNIVNQRVGWKLLESLGCTVDLAHHGREAVEVLARQRYDLVFMDCQMPEMDGWEATRQFRLMEGGRRRTPIVAMTAAAMSEDRLRCIECGMDDFLAKPIQLAELRRIVSTYCPAAGVDITTGKGAAG